MNVKKKAVYTPAIRDNTHGVPDGEYLLRLNADEIAYLWALSYVHEGGKSFPQNSSDYDNGNPADTDVRLTYALEILFPHINGTKLHVWTEKYRGNDWRIPGINVNEELWREA